MAKALSVVIPSRNELKNLLWTLQGLQVEIARGEYDFEIIAVLNQCDDADHERLSKFWPMQTEQIKVVRYDDRSSCWQARNAGAAVATGDYLVFLDSHVMFTSGSLAWGLEYHRQFKGILAFGVNYWLDHPARTLFQYRWQPHKFWGSWSRKRPEPPDHRILMSGMNLMIDRGVFEEIGGFHPALGIYGGGEPYVYFKTQLYGYEARCNPAFQVYHLTEKRGYAWNNDDLWRNFMIAAWAIGGNVALTPLYENYVRCCNDVPHYLERLEELKAEAIKLAEEDRHKTAREASLTFREVLERGLII